MFPANISKILGPYCGRCREEVGVIATFFKVHHHIEQGDLVSTPTRVQGLEIACENELVVFSG